MKVLGLFLCLLCIAPDKELATVRQQYIDAAVSAESALVFHASLEDLDNSHENTTLLAYKAASIVLMAKYEKGLFTKTRYFNKGTDLLEQVIEKDAKNYEARLLRLNIQDNVPWITGYTGDIKKDKAFLIANYAAQPNDLKVFTKNYVVQCDAFSDKEKAAFN